MIHTRIKTEISFRSVFNYNTSSKTPIYRQSFLEKTGISTLGKETTSRHVTANYSFHCFAPIKDEKGKIIDHILV